MIELNDTEFNAIVSDSIDAIPEKYQKYLQNVAFIVEDEPSSQQRSNLRLKPYESLFGLYEGVPLPGRGGTTKLLPDKITVFKLPIQAASRDRAHLMEIVKNTVWHEVAHYFGLDHLRIDELQQKPPKNKKPVD